MCSSRANCSPAGGIGSKVKWLISWPLLLLLYFTVPNCAKPRWEKYFMVSFLLSTVWIAVFSYLMVWMVSMKCIWKGFLLRLNSSFIALPQNEWTWTQATSLFCLKGVQKLIFHVQGWSFPHSCKHKCCMFWTKHFFFSVIYMVYCLKWKFLFWLKCTVNAFVEDKSSTYTYIGKQATSSSL